MTFSCDQKQGFTLVITLIMVVLAAILVVGLLVSATADRATAVSYDQRFQAELAAQDGLEAAKQALTYDGGGNAITQDDTFGVVRAAVSNPSSPADEDSVPHYYFIAHYQSGNKISYYPLFSGGQAQPGITVGTNPSVSWTGPQAAATDGSGNNYPMLFSTAPHSSWQKASGSSPIHTSWVTVPATAPTNQRYYRYAYWAEDLAGYVDANVAGNLDNNTVTPNTHIRSLGYDPKEVALFTLFKSSVSTDDGSTYANNLIGDHGFLFTRLTSRLGTTTNSSDDKVCTASLTANLQVDQEQTVIPLGLGYANEGTVKTNLNAIISKNPNDTGVGQIASAVSAALPKFASKRQGSLTDDYNKTLAANIIGYASATNTPLVGSNYRGITLMPFVTEVYEMYYWKTDYFQKGNPPAGDYFVDIEAKTYAQLWNMFNQSITSGTLSFQDTLTAGLKFGSTPGTTSSFDQGTKISPNATTVTFSAAAPLQSNEYRPVLVSDVVYEFDTKTMTKPIGSIDISDHVTPTSSATDQDSSYTVSWNGVAYDRPGLNAGQHLAMERNVAGLTAVGSVKLVGTVPALRYTKTNGKAPYLLGDPRMSYYINGTQYTSSYAGGTAWGGAVYMKTLVEGSNWIAGESRVGGWADGGHSSVRGATPATDPTSITQDPTTVNTNPTIDPTKAPARTSNRSDGRIYSTTELSYVYDPFQWDPFGTTNAPTTADGVDSGWHNTWKTAFPNFSTGALAADDGTYGSHSTLRIGRPEHKSFDQPGTRAWQLLDIFSAGNPADSSSAGAISNQISTRGRININTASREALRTLGAGIKFANDQAIQPATVYGPQTSAAADAFADNVIAQRQTQPFISTSQLAALPGSAAVTAGLTATVEPFFGNPDQWSSGGPTVEQTDTISTTTSPTITKGTADWNDGAEEEYFAKIYNFTTVRSRNFRVFVTGQYVDPTHLDSSGNPTVIATANKIYEVFLKPTRDSNGAITAQTSVVTYQADIP